MSVQTGPQSEVERLTRELDRVRAECNAQQAELIGAAKLATLGSLVAGIAHELNTPIGALNSNHDVLRRAINKLQVILEDEVVDASELEEVRRVVKALDGVMKVNDLAVERMVQLVTSLRSFGRPDRADRDQIDIHESIDSTLAIIGHQLRDRVTVIREFGTLPRIECYAQQLNQVFMNVLVNAAQAISGPGTITIRTWLSAERVVIEVQDTGVGIAKENLERIFEPGFTTKGGRIGMGLGMLIVRQTIERHKGQIRVSSQLGVGTTVTIELPVKLSLQESPGRKE